MKKVFTTIVLSTFAFTLWSQEAISISEFENLDNSSWKGTLMYINYADGKEVYLNTTMQIKIEGNTIQMITQFGDEPNANSTDKITISEKGKKFGNEKIIEKSKKNGMVKIVTAYKGKDDNRSATIEKTYLIGNNKFSVTKKVTFNDSKKTLLRNKYSYSKI